MLREHLPKHADDTFRIVEDLVVPKARDPEALRLQPRRPLPILRLPFAMLAAVDLDDEAMRKAGEVGDIGTEGHLSAKAAAVDLSPSEDRPEALFSFRWVPAQGPGTV